MFDDITSIEFLESKFPDLAVRVHGPSVEGLLHNQMGAFAKMAQNAIDDEDKDGWRRITDTFKSLWSNCTPEVKNALSVSFLEHLNFRDGKRYRSWAYDKMPAMMRCAFDEMEAYNKKLYGNR